LQLWCFREHRTEERSECPKVFYHKNANRHLMRRRSRSCECNRRVCDHDGSLQYRSVGFARIRLDVAREVAEETPYVCTPFPRRRILALSSVKREFMHSPAESLPPSCRARKPSGHVSLRLPLTSPFQSLTLPTGGLSKMACYI
jgi:hypothetical protein